MMNCKNNKIIVIIFLAMLLFWINSFSQTSQTSSTQNSAGGISTSYPFIQIGTSGSPISAGKTTGGAGNPFSIIGGFIATLPESDFQTPKIAHNKLDALPEGQEILITADITDNVGISEAILWYRKGGAGSFRSKQMEFTSGNYQAKIDAEYVTNHGVDYFLQAVDRSGNGSFSPSDSDYYSIRISIDGEGISRGIPQPAGSEENSYRLISIPINADNKSPAAVLEDDLGTYDDTKWRFFELRADQQYYEYQTISDIKPGEGFWLITKEPGKVIDTGPGITNKTNEEFTFSLHAGWNFIGNPFNFSIPYKNLRMEDGSSFDIRSYLGNWAFYTDSLQPFSGYLLSSTTTTNLLIDPDLSTGTAKLLEKITPTKNNEHWGINIIAACQYALDNDNFALVIPEASDGWDSYDRPEPPVIGKFVSVYFPHNEWNNLFKVYCIDARPEFLNGYTWQFEVKSNMSDYIKLYFEKIDNIPSEFEIWLVDDLLKTVSDLNESKFYRILNADEDHPRKLSIVVGDSSYIQNEFNELQVVSSSYALYQNFPNPFNSSTTIRYQIPIASEVKLDIYNILGKKVESLVNEYQPAGYHYIIWNISQNNDQLASGVYFLRLTIKGMEGTEFEKTTKMLYIK